MSLLDRLSTAAGWTIGRMMPVDQKKVVFSGYYGKGFGDSPKAIALALHAMAPELKLIWLTDCDAEAANLPDYITAKPYSSMQRCVELCTAKVWVDNCRKGARVKKPGQKYLQTWHGFALKRIEGDTADTLPKEYPDYAKRDSQQIDLLISDSRFMTEVYRRAFWYDGEIAEYGLPRNDRLIHRDGKTAEVVRNRLGLGMDEKLVLYAPTFRADGSVEACRLDFDRLKQACEDRFGGSFRVLLRMHPNAANLAGELLRNYHQVVNVTDYPDGQELLEAANVLLTDYSSVMFDFMLTGKPCFQYAADLAAYKNDRNFYLPLDSLPFPLGEDGDSLMDLIRDYDEADYGASVQKFIHTQGIITDGKAAQRCAEWIIRQLGA